MHGDSNVKFTTVKLSVTHCVVIRKYELTDLCTRLLVLKYRVYTKGWCGLPLFTIETAPFFCVYPVLFWLLTSLHILES